MNIAYEGIFETHINVTDLERSAAFYEQILGRPEAGVIPWEEWEAMVGR